MSSLVPGYTPTPFAAVAVPSNSREYLGWGHYCLGIAIPFLIVMDRFPLYVKPAVSATRVSMVDFKR